MPFGERYTSTAGFWAAFWPAVAGRSSTNPLPVTASPLIWGCAPGPAGVTAGGTASVQVVPPSVLSQAAPAGTVRVWPGRPVVRDTPPAIRIRLP